MAVRAVAGKVAGKATLTVGVAAVVGMAAVAAAMGVAAVVGEVVQE